jgi:hypothetical protein
LNTFIFKSRINYQMSDSQQSTIIGEYTKVLLVTIHHATGLKKADFMGASDPYVKIDNFDGLVNTDKARTSIIESSLNPEWNESFLFLIGEDTKRFTINVYDKDLSGDDKLGKVGVLTSANYVKFEQALDVKGSITYTSLALPIHVAATLPGNFIIPAGFEFKMAEGKDNHYDRLLVATIQNAKVRNADWFGKSDPYVWLRDFEGGEIFDNTLKGPWKKDELEPCFNETYTTLLEPGVKCYSVHLYDYDDLMKDILGKAFIRLDDERTTGSLALDSEGFVEVNSVVVSAELIAAAAQGTGWFATTLTPGGIKPMRGWTSIVYYFAINDNASVEVTVEAGGTTLIETAEINESGYGTLSFDFTPQVKLTKKDAVNITTKILLDREVKSSIQSVFNVC